MTITRRSLLAGGAAPLFAQRRSSGPPPSIVMIAADGVGAWMLGCYGNKEFQTPNLDALAQAGARFVNSFAASGDAASSRASLLSGLTVRQHGVAPGATSVPSPLAKWLATAGYDCGAASGATLGEVTATASAFLDAQSPAKPFFLSVFYPEPPLDSVAAPFLVRYASTPFTTIGWLLAAPNARDGRERLADIVGNLRRAAAGLSEFDAQIPVLRRKLLDRRLTDNTLLVCTATCGRLLGRHGLWDSARASAPENLFDEVVQVPLLVSWPGKIPIQAVRPEMVSGHDLLPTFCDFAGLAPPVGKRLCGMSWKLPAMNRPLPKKQRFQDVVFAQSGDTEMARDNRFKLIVRPEGPNEFYAIRTDPRELTNQYENPSFVSMRDELARRHAAWHEEFA